MSGVSLPNTSPNISGTIANLPKDAGAGAPPKRSALPDCFFVPADGDVGGSCVAAIERVRSIAAENRCGTYAQGPPATRRQLRNYPSGGLTVN